MTPLRVVVSVRKSAFDAWGRLQAAMRDASGPVPCTSRPELWTSDQEADRHLAAQLCARCPVLSECAAFAIANDERFGVWGGKYMSDHTVRSTINREETK